MAFTVHVPATSANLGPGFDCLGLALDIWNEVRVEETGNSLQINIVGKGADFLPRTSGNAIFKAMQKTAEVHGKNLKKGLEIHCTNNIPLGSGLGSSAAANVAGILAAYRLLGIADNVNDQLNLAAELEGHPDNVAPCLLGGLTASTMNGKTVVTKNIPIFPISLLVMTPDFYLPTRQARAVLPTSIPREDAVFNLSRSVLLVEALRTGDFDLIKKMLQDRLHQPYRIPLIPGAEPAIKAGVESGAVAVVISGAGPSLLAILEDFSKAKKISDEMSRAFLSAGIPCEIRTPSISHKGAYLTE